jgi:hypothetical protein
MKGLKNRAQPLYGCLKLETTRRRLYSLGMRDIRLPFKYFVVCLLLLLFGCSWKNFIVLYYSFSGEKCPSQEVSLPATITLQDGYAPLKGEPVKECKGAFAYSDRNSQIVLYAKIHRFTKNIEMKDGLILADRCALITIGTDLNLPSGPITKDLFPVEFAKASNDFVNALSGSKVFPKASPSFVGEIIKGSDLKTELKEYCQ